ncbi:MAG: mercury resistance system periplasmic binding protein MerP [Methylococcales bacterium]
MKCIMVLIISLLLSGLLSAAEQSVVLSIPGMNCPVCPITIKKSLQKVAGVKTANVIFKSKLAEVTFDDQVTDINQLKQATENVGYPSQLQEENSHGK